MRWRLLAALLVLILAALSWAAYGPAAILLTRSWPWPPTSALRPTGLNARQIVAFALVVAHVALFLLVIPSCSYSPETLRCWQCVNNLRQVSHGLLQYEEKNGSLPPACTYDKQGEPMHSWRVSILPYIDEWDLYKKYKLDEPWGGPNNRKLLAERPPIYGCPSDETAWHEGSTTTNYVGVVGSRAAWQQNKTTQLKEIAAQGMSKNTVLLIEIPDSGIPWTEPKDFLLDDIATLANDSSKPVIHGSHHHWDDDNGFFYLRSPPGVNVVFADGHVGYLPGNCLTADKLQSLLAIGGCKEEDIERLSRNESVRVNWPLCFGFPTWFISAGLLFFMAVRGRKKAKKPTIPDAEIEKSP